MRLRDVTQAELAREALHPIGVAIRFDEDAELALLKAEATSFDWADFCGRAKWERTMILQRRCIARIKKEMAKRPAGPPKVNHKARIDARNERRKNRRLYG